MLSRIFSSKGDEIVNFKNVFDITRLENDIKIEKKKVEDLLNKIEILEKKNHELSEKVDRLNLLLINKVASIKERFI
jgi:hypothetical protein|nr:MAG TPA: hypothetical protein [Caudoviricetes sp.]